MPLLYDIPQACERTSIGRSTLYKLVSSGDIESVKVGRRRLIPEEALTAFVENIRAAQAGGRAAADRAGGAA